MSKKKTRATISARGKSADLDDPKAVAEVLTEAFTPRAKQTRIPGTEATSFPEVNAAADLFLDARAKSKAVREFEKDATESLIEKMRGRKLLHYSDPASGLTIELDSRDRVVVKRKKARHEDAE